jgi:DNA repair exonuclease SbcCD ATPase subunit
MRVELQTLTFTNMFSYGEQNSIDLTGEKIRQLVAGVGSGKTSICLILQELLYSKNVKGIKKSNILNRYLDKKSWSGSLDFTVDSIPYKVEVSRTGASSKVFLYKDGVDISEHKVPDTYKKLSDIIGMNFETFSQLTYQSSTDLLDFIKATDTNRKKFLISLFKLNRYVEIGEHIKKLSSEVEKKHATVSGELSGVNRFLEETVIKEPLSVKEVPQLDDTLKAQLGVKEQELREFKDTCSKIDKNLLFIKERDYIQFDVALQKPEIDKSIVDEAKEKSKILTVVSSDIKKAQSRIKDLDMSDRCYACNQPIDNSQSIEIKQKLEEQVELLQKQEHTLKHEIQLLNSQIKKYNADLKEYKDNKEKIDRFEQLSQVIDLTLPTTHPDYSLLENEIKLLKTKISAEQQEYDKIVSYNTNVKLHNSKIETLIEQKRQFLVRQQLLNDEIISLNSKINSFSVLKKAFSPSGIVAFKLEALTKELENTINYYLSELSDGKFQLEFRLEGEKLNIVIINDNIESPVETVSGGEFSKIQTSILLSIRNLLTKLGGNSINILFLDEIFAVLGNSEKEKLIEILMEEEGLNTFLVSHEYEHPLVPKVRIVKQDNISYIE